MPKEQKGHRVHLSWWLIVLAVVVFGATFAYISFSKNKNNGNIKIKVDTANEIKIKQNLSSLRGDIVRYHDNKQTYVGWSANQTAIQEVKKMGSELKTQALTKDTYIIYAKMPSSKTIFCMDQTGFTGNIKSLGFWQKTCK